MPEVFLAHVNVALSTVFCSLGHMWIGCAYILSLCSLSYRHLKDSRRHASRQLLQSGGLPQLNWSHPISSFVNWFIFLFCECQLVFADFKVPSLAPQLPLVYTEKPVFAFCLILSTSDLSDCVLCPSWLMAGFVLFL